MACSSSSRTYSPVQPRGPTVVSPHDHRVAGAAHLARAAERGAPELGDRDGFPLRATLRDECANLLAEARGSQGRPAGSIGGDDVERGPVDALQRELASVVEQTVSGECPTCGGEPYEATFARVKRAALRAATGSDRVPEVAPQPRKLVPGLTEPWFC